MVELIFLSFFFLNYLMCLGVLSTCMPVYHLNAWYLLTPEEGI